MVILDLGDTGTGQIDNLSGAASDCQYLSASPLLQVSEVFRGNEQRDFFIEIELLQDLTWEEFVLSGSFLAQPLVVSLSGLVSLGLKGQRIIISSGQKRSNEAILHLDNQELSASESG